jgi:hypothetical protein
MINYAVSVLKRELYRLMDKFEELEQGRAEVGVLGDKGRQSQIASVAGTISGRIKEIQDAIGVLDGKN